MWEKEAKEEEKHWFSGSLSAVRSRGRGQRGAGGAFEWRNFIPEWRAMQRCPQTSGRRVSWIFNYPNELQLMSGAFPAALRRDPTGRTLISDGWWDAPEAASSSSSSSDGLKLCSCRKHVLHTHVWHEEHASVLHVSTVSTEAAVWRAHSLSQLPTGTLQYEIIFTVILNSIIFSYYLISLKMTFTSSFLLTYRQ